jgi:very-short-patch-repair endonuclease
MHELDHALDEIARRNDDVLTRADVLAAGGTDRTIENRLARGLWQPLQAGVYLVGSAPPTWTQLLRAGVAAGGEGTLVSHRAALLQWRLDGLVATPPELVVPYNGRPTPVGVIVHRSRRIEPASIVDGIPTTSVERALLESAPLVPPVVTEKAFAAAWRRGLTTPAKCERYLEEHGGRGRAGVTRLREVVAIYAAGGRAPGSGGEVAFLRHLRAAGIEEPMRQFEIALPDGSVAVADFAWPERRKLIEFEGLESHSDSRALAYDTLREDEVRTAGWDLRRFAAHTLHADPTGLARRAHRFLSTHVHPSRGQAFTERRTGAGGRGWG